MKKKTKKPAKKPDMQWYFDALKDAEDRGLRWALLTVGAEAATRGYMVGYRKGQQDARKKRGKK